MGTAGPTEGARHHGAQREGVAVHVDERLLRLLGGEALAALRQRLRRHFERRDDGNAGEMPQLTQLSAAEHAALAQLSGRPARPARSARVDVAAIDAALQAAGIADSLRAALELLDGPITSRAALQAARAAAWSAVTDATDAPDRHPMLHAWLQAPQATPLLKRLCRQDQAAATALLARADAVLQRLPAAGLPRAQLAATVLGNAHALDAGQPAATIVLAVWRQVDSAAESDGDGDPERSRDTWARAGVLVNELARPALVLNLPGYGAAGEPAYLSLRQLLRQPPRWELGGTEVFVCENPNLLAIAADQLGASCAPLVCTEGMPAAAQRTLLAQLAQAGARLRVHADFDWPGLRIANQVLLSWPAQAWRMAARDYEAAVQTAARRTRDLADADIAAAWDTQLAAAMHLHGLSIAEEALADSLIEDLRLA